MRRKGDNFSEMKVPARRSQAGQGRNRMGTGGPQVVTAQRLITAHSLALRLGSAATLQQGPPRRGRATAASRLTRRRLHGSDSLNLPSDGTRQVGIQKFAKQFFEPYGFSSMSVLDG